MKELAETSPEIISTKVIRPPQGSDVVIRPRLVERLNQGLYRPITVISAPAGFGKSTLVSSWLDDLVREQNGEDDTRVGWLTLDTDDNQLFVFCRYLVAAVRSAYPGSCESAYRLLRAPVEPTTDAFTSAWLNDLAQLPSRCILVLEDCHTLSDETVLETFEAICRHLPPRFRLVLTSRADPPIPLSRLRANDQITELRTRDLRFTRDECVAFLLNALPNPLSPLALDAIHKRTEGWIAGLRLVALSLAAVTDTDTAVFELAGMNDFIADYLVDEVFSQQTPDVQQFLLVMSLFDRFCAELAEALLLSGGQAGSTQETIQLLERTNLFIAPMDQVHQWYRFHPLFREVLLKRLWSDYPDADVHALYRAAASWFAHNECPDEALRSALSAHDVGFAATLMQSRLCEALNRGDRLTLERWIQLIPEEHVGSHIGLLLLKTWFLELSWQLTAQADVLKQIELLLAEGGYQQDNPEAEHLIRGQLAAIYCQNAYFDGDYEESIANAQRALDLLPYEWMYVRGGTVIFLTLSLQAIGQGDNAVYFLTREYEAHSGRAANSYSLRLLFSLCLVHHLNVQYGLVRQIALVMLTRGMEVQNFTIIGWAHYFLGVADYARNLVSQARSHFEAVIEIQYAIQALCARVSSHGLALAHAAAGDIDEAQQTVALLSKNDIVHHGAEDNRTQSLRARVELLSGQLANASNWADTYVTPPSVQPFPWLEEPSLTQARILVARNREGDAELALSMLDKLLERAECNFSMLLQIDIRALRALALGALPDRDPLEALKCLRQSLEQAHSGSQLRNFIDMGQPMRSLLSELVASEFNCDFAVQVLAAFKGPNQERLDEDRRLIAHVPTIEHFTPREIDVLVRMRQRKSNKEIAEELVISVATTKRHANNIFGKLGVKRRWDAVAKAEALGLIPSD